MKKEKSINDLLLENQKIYQIPDDRLYSVDDLIYNHQKFIFLYQKTIEKEPVNTSKLDISTAWFFALINRFHIDLEKLAFQRYSNKCPFCLEIPCFCQKESPIAQKTGRPTSIKPKTISEWQLMIKKIYPDSHRSEILEKFSKSLNELQYLFRHFIREKKKSQFHKIEIACVDHFILILRTYNSIKVNLDKNFRKLFHWGCYICHKIPCECNYFE